MRDLIATILRAPDDAGWESWLALLSAGVADPQAFAEALSSLPIDDQLEWVDAIRTDGSVFSDSLQVLTAREADAIEDEEVRELLVGDAAPAAERLGNRLAAQRDELTALIAAAQQQSDPDFDIAAEVTRLEAELLRLRGSMIGERFEGKVKLDREIRRLEAFARSLERYDESARTAYRDDLVAQTAAQAQVRDEVERDVETAIAERDTRQRAVDEAERRRDEIREELAALEQRLADLDEESAATESALEQQRASTESEATAERARLDQLRTEIETANQRLTSEVADARGQLTTLESRQAELRRELSAERARLDELRASPGAQANDEVRSLIDQVYARLPADDAEAQFGS